MTRVNFLNPFRRGWLARVFLGAGLCSAFGGASLVQAADYEGEKVAEFIREMTHDYGFASEQLVDLFALIICRKNRWRVS